MFRAWWMSFAVVVGSLLGNGLTAQAQGLLWSLPEDGTWVKYTGTYQHKQERPNNNAGPLEMTFLTELTIQSVGTETADFEGIPTACRWIEFKLVTGKEAGGGANQEAGIVPGPHGTRIYKVLIPEDRVQGKLVDSKGLPITYLPIVKGYRKLGSKPVEAVTEKVLQTYPLLTLFANYLNLQEEGEESIDLSGYGTVPATKFAGSLKLQSSTSRSENTGEIWLSPEVPFGWAKYHVKFVREQKRTNAPDDDFAPIAEMEVELAAAEKGTGAKSELTEMPEAAASN